MCKLSTKTGREVCGGFYCRMLCKTGTKENGGDVVDLMHGRSRMYDHISSHPYDAGAEHAGFSPTRQALLAPSLAKRREGAG